MSNEDQLLSDVTYEAIPLLATNPDFQKLAERARLLKQYKDEIFTDKKDKSGVPLGEWNRLRMELGAMVAVAGVKSVVYQDLRIGNTEAKQAGEPGSGPVNGAMLVGHLQGILAGFLGGERLTPNATRYIELLESIIAAAHGFDEEALLDAGVPPYAISMSQGVGKGRAASVRLEWVGKKGPNAAAKQGSGGNGTVQ